MTKAKKPEELRKDRVDRFKVYRVHDLGKEDRNALVQQQSARASDSSTWFSKRSTTFMKRAGMLSVEASLDWEANLRDAQDKLMQDLQLSQPDDPDAGAAASAASLQGTPVLPQIPESPRRKMLVPGQAAVFVAVISAGGQMRSAGSACFKRSPQQLEEVQSALLQSWSSHQQYLAREYYDTGRLPGSHVGAPSFRAGEAVETSATFQLQHVIGKAMQAVLSSVRMQLADVSSEQIIESLKAAGMQLHGDGSCQTGFCQLPLSSA